ncbi:PAS domain-containing protein [uncultured Methylobacterium sp.]|uniref:PAS domain-containing protein n=1 Tax=uncultured Methylobacterium sp. TaxID=157278 RepID=UPI0025926853|nr:PAS domain-containing protein [uncultured Methylobacterium sp.]
MTIVELVRAFTQDAPVAVVLTDSTVNSPGPTILYANPAFGQLTGRDHHEVVGLSPRFMQGRETRRPRLDAFRRALAAGQRFHGFLTNYRGDGTKYLVEIDCRTLRDDAGTIQHFLAFEREVVRRIGRPASGAAGRYESVGLSNDSLSDSLRAVSVFQSA